MQGRTPTQRVIPLPPSCNGEQGAVSTPLNAVLLLLVVVVVVVVIVMIVMT